MRHATAGLPAPICVDSSGFRGATALSTKVYRRGLCPASGARLKELPNDPVISLR